MNGIISKKPYKRDFQQTLHHFIDPICNENRKRKRTPTHTYGKDDCHQFIKNEVSKLVAVFATKHQKDNAIVLDGGRGCTTQAFYGIMPKKWKGKVLIPNNNDKDYTSLRTLIQNRMWEKHIHVFNNSCEELMEQKIRDGVQFRVAYLDFTCIFNAMAERCIRLMTSQKMDDDEYCIVLTISTRNQKQRKRNKTSEIRRFHGGEFPGEEKVFNFMKNIDHITIAKFSMVRYRSTNGQTMLTMCFMYTKTPM